ncbi:MAG: chromate transporter [Bacteroidetes bacterium]|uniref:Chromate transporter n=1 Tax=Candidatus Cryptobacteroides merdigallinarum TaxID=2840770 RepID=A0A9D9HFD4_9BACT|nr:chromate transporter [Candidatus Cryptobacteroides merdigallinarum]
MILVELFLTFFIIGLFTIGGGYAMLSLIQTQVVTVHNWIDENTFTDIVAISQMTPGPIGINSATYIGYSVLEEAGAPHLICILASFTTSLAVVLPSFIIVLSMCRMYYKFSGNTMFSGIMSGLKPAVVGLIGASAILLITPENFPDWKSWVLFSAAFLVSWIWKVSPIIVIIAGGITGFLVY